MIVKGLYMVAALGWIIHLAYWCIQRRQYKKKGWSGDDMFRGLFSDYVLATFSIVMICLLGMYGVYFGG